MSTTNPLRHLFCIVLLAFSPVLLAEEKERILVLGDSLSAGYGIELKDSWVSLLAKRLATRPYQVINASVSGETSGGGLARLPALLKEHEPSFVIVELGGNDGLRGHPLNIMEQQLQSIIHQSQDAGAKVLLLGMQIPPNYGQRYTERFHQIYTQLAKEHDLAYVPFFLEGVAVKRDLMQRDGIHPTAQAQPIMLDNVWMGLEPLLTRD